MSQQKNPWAWGQPYVEGGVEPEPEPPAQPPEAPPVETPEPPPVDPPEEEIDEEIDGEDDLAEALPTRFTSHSAAERWLEVNDLEAPDGWGDMTLAEKRAAFDRG